MYANTHIHTSSARDLIKGCEIEHVPPSDSVKLDVTDLDCILTVTSDTSAGRMCGVLLLRVRTEKNRECEYELMRNVKSKYIYIEREKVKEQAIYANTRSYKPNER